ncbi:hypothetical protein KCU90_g2824, partial [Aureobasidium melanogenum]
MPGVDHGREALHAAHLAHREALSVIARDHDRTALADQHQFAVGQLHRAEIRGADVTVDMRPRAALIGTAQHVAAHARTLIGHGPLLPTRAVVGREEQRAGFARDDQTATCIAGNRIQVPIVGGRFLLGPGGARIVRNEQLAEAAAGEHQSARIAPHRQQRVRMLAIEVHLAPMRAAIDGTYDPAVMSYRDADTRRDKKHLGKRGRFVGGHRGLPPGRARVVAQQNDASLAHRDETPARSGKSVDLQAVGLNGSRRESRQRARRKRKQRRAQHGSREQQTGVSSRVRALSRYSGPTQSTYSGSMQSSECGLRRYFEECRSAHAAADAHRYDEIAHAAPPRFKQAVHRHTGAGHPERMANRDRTAIHVQTVRRNMQLIAAVDHLARERLIHLPQPDVIHPGDSHAAIHAERRQTALLRRRRAHHNHRRRAVGQLRCIARGNEFALRDRLAAAPDRLERRQTGRAGIGTIAFVAARPHGFAAGRLAFLVEQRALRVEGHDLFVEAARSLSRRRALLTRQRVLVLRLT